MAIAVRDFTYFDRSWSEGDKVDDDDPVVTLMPQMFEHPSAKPKKKAANPATPKKERP